MRSLKTPLALYVLAYVSRRRFPQSAGTGLCTLSRTRLPQFARPVGMTRPSYGTFDGAIGQQGQDGATSSVDPVPGGAALVVEAGRTAAVAGVAGFVPFFGAAGCRKSQAGSPSLRSREYHGTAAALAYPRPDDDAAQPHVDSHRPADTTCFKSTTRKSHHQ